MTFSIFTEILCPAFSQSKPDKSDTVKDDTTGTIDCYDSKTRSIGTKCKVTCSEGYKPTASGETSTCTLEPISKLSATWEGTLACEGIYICSELYICKWYQH